LFTKLRTCSFELPRFQNSPFQPGKTSLS
jgi:hypothetical protein